MILVVIRHLLLLPTKEPLVVLAQLLTSLLMKDGWLLLWGRIQFKVCNEKKNYNNLYWLHLNLLIYSFRNRWWVGISLMWSVLVHILMEYKQNKCHYALINIESFEFILIFLQVPSFAYRSSCNYSWWMWGGNTSWYECTLWGFIINNCLPTRSESFADPEGLGVGLWSSCFFPKCF